MFQWPHPIDVQATVEVPTPASWQEAMPGQATVPVLRLCDGKGPAMPGWCAAAPELAGPEIEVMCGGINSKQPTHAGLWRQGHLLHFGFEPAPGEYNDTGRKLLLNGIAYIARFTTDRPIVRTRTFADPQGAGPSRYWLDFMLTSGKAQQEDLAAMFAAPWQERIAAEPSLADARAFVRQHLGAMCCAGRKFTFDDDALAFGVDLRERASLARLTGMLADPATAAPARALLQRLLPDGPPPDTTPNNWRNWLQPRLPALCFDPLSLVWRLDPVAHWRSFASDDLRGPARADGDAVRDPAAAELAAKVVAHHGGRRALDDLATFACRFGEVRCLWDRRAGIFRLENGGTIPAGNLGTPWRVVVFDTAADVDLVRGGGPAPRPFVSGRGFFRELQERLFLPLLLLDPGTSLRLLPDDAEGRACLEVRLGARCADLRKTMVLHIVRASGAVTAVDEREPPLRSTPWTVAGTLQVGPLLLPAKWVRNTRVRDEVEYVDAVWNPAVPAAAATSLEFVLGGK
ncbi:MAG: hypothetical protein WAT39_26145 [Planctomycetota bacterium]